MKRQSAWYNETPEQIEENRKWWISHGWEPVEPTDYFQKTDDCDWSI